eukprot:TRINITY_DN20772_c0_g6_i1.p1 TRINITY_DN20772_c0_g6~~TRINITY_DN20772_c0_g6_i1.p1  ORF type:complete len:808 (-),score=103.10 TRINITY_DN20772_c0_g6_i1:165-2588(-)
MRARREHGLRVAGAADGTLLASVLLLVFVASATAASTGASGGRGSCDAKGACAAVVNGDGVLPSLGDEDEGADSNALLQHLSPQRRVRDREPEASLEARSAAGNLVVNATCSVLAEDHFPEDVAYEYGACVLQDGTVLYVVDEAPFKVLEANEEVTVELQPLRAEVERSRSRKSRARPSYAGAITYRAIKVTRHPQRKSRLRQMKSTDEHSLISIRLEYNDAEPSYCNESCVIAGMWGKVSIWNGVVNGSVDGVTRNSSYNASSWPREMGKVLTVKMGTDTPSSSVSCPWDSGARLADQKVMEQYGIDPLQYMHREYFVPFRWGDCSFGGLGVVGCAYPGLGQAGGCRTWIRDKYPMTRAHEFGHNFGLMHAGTPGSEYGDASAVMGADRAWNAFTAGARVQLGWLPDEAIFDFTASTTVSLQSLHLPPLSLDGQWSAVRFQCPPENSACKSGGIEGGHIIIAFRAAVGYDDDLQPEYEDRVHIQLLRKYQDRRYGTGTQLFAALANGESYSVIDHHIQVCETSKDSAKILIIKGEVDPDATLVPSCSSDNTSFPTPLPTPRSFANFTMHSGYISEGGSLMVASMTVEEATITCDKLAGCMGFTFPGELGDPGFVHRIYFKNKFDNYGTGWTSFSNNNAGDVMPVDVPVYIVNYQSDRALYSQADKNWGDGFGAGSPYWDVHHDGLWLIKETQPMSGVFRVQNMFSGRTIYAKRGWNWSRGVGAGSPSDMVGDDGNWKIERVAGHVYRFVNDYSDRALYAAEDENWESGVGAGYPPANVGRDGNWLIDPAPPSIPPHPKPPAPSPGS